MTFSRRSILALLTAAAVTGMTASVSFADEVNVGDVIDKFTKIRSMSGEFVQFDYNGNPSEGTFAILRPGMARFDYRNKGGLNILADGKTVAVENRRLKTWDLYPLSRTPLNLLLGDRIDVTTGIIKYMVEKDGLIVIMLADKKTFGNSTIEIFFDKNTSELRQWTLLDEARRETTVVVHNLKVNTPLPKHVFRIPYKDIRERN